MVFAMVNAMVFVEITIMRKLQLCRNYNCAEITIMHLDKMSVLLLRRDRQARPDKRRDRQARSDTLPLSVVRHAKGVGLCRQEKERENMLSISDTLNVPNYHTYLCVDRCVSLTA